MSHLVESAVANPRHPFSDLTAFSEINQLMAEILESNEELDTIVSDCFLTSDSPIIKETS